jgi:hypothetical protein
MVTWVGSVRDVTSLGFPLDTESLVTFWTFCSYPSRFQNLISRGWGCSAIVEDRLGLYDALGSTVQFPVCTRTHLMIMITIKTIEIRAGGVAQVVEHLPSKCETAFKPPYC